MIIYKTNQIKNKMPHTDRGSHEEHRHASRASGVAWLALLVAALSFLIGVAAYNRSGEDLDARFRTGYEDLERETRLQFARLNAAVDLGRIEARRAANQNYPEFERDVEEVRTDLRQAYENAKMEGSESWREINSFFDRLITNIRNGTDNIDEDVREVIDRLRRND